MKQAKINQTKLLFVATIRMTVQLILAGLFLSFLFHTNSPLFTLGYLVVMMGFSIHRALQKQKWLPPQFQWSVACSMFGSGFFILAFFLLVVIRTPFSNPQYAIPIGGMIFGNTMTGVTLALKTFSESLQLEQDQIQTLFCFGVKPQKILQPIANRALETALLPTLNNMVGMGIVSLPGMMTGQMLSGTLPTTAILYQISIMIAICAAACLAVFCSLLFGVRTMCAGDWLKI